MQHLGIRKELHPVELENGQFELPVALWTLKKEEKHALISFFNELKVPMGYCLNPKRLVNMRELKFNYGPMKAHDYHVIMTQLLPVALRGIIPKGPCPNHKDLLVLQYDLKRSLMCPH